MATTAVPIRVTIGLKPNGHALYPDWTTLPSFNTEEKVSAAQIVKWRYDKTSGHQDDTPESPRGQQFGMMLVTRAFADEALAAFPGTVVEMTEAEAQDFWENKATAHIPENRVDTNLLLSLKAELDLREALAQDTTALKARIAKALDPADKTEPGIVKDPTKKWVDAKASIGITVAVAAPK